MKTFLGHIRETKPAPSRAPTDVRENKEERQLAKVAGLTQFGVNHLSLQPGSQSSRRHWHEGEDEFVYVLSGVVTLHDENGERDIGQGCFVGFPAGERNAHHLLNRGDAVAEILVVGTRKVGEERIHYPDQADPGPISVVRDVKDSARRPNARGSLTTPQPNFRGSSGYTSDFITAGYGQWGRKMQTDLSDGVRALVAQGVVDPKRVCIFGWSYGGYAALAGATLDHGVYRCAADMAGPADLRRMLNRVQTLENTSKNSTQRYWDRFMGASGPNDLSLDLISPSDQAAKADIPILIVHGKDDTVVDYHQSQVMADALSRAGKPYTLVTLKGEDHWGSRSETRLQLLSAVMEFFLKNNPPE